MGIGRPRAVGLLVLFMMSAGACSHERSRTPESAVPHRIVSMSPALTETLFALDLGDRVVGVTRFCLEPEAARQLPKVGGFMDPNWEAVVSLDPDLVVLMESHAAAERRLRSLGLPTQRVSQASTTDILASIRSLALTCGVPERGERLCRSIERDLAEIEEIMANREPRRTVISVGRQPGTGPVRSVWAAGPGTFLDDALRLAGGINVVPGGLGGQYPEISLEGLFHLDPDVVIDLVPELEAMGMTADQALRDWNDLRGLRAVADGQVIVLGQHFLTVPGPRVAEVVECFARALHPDAGWREIR